MNNFIKYIFKNYDKSNSLNNLMNNNYNLYSYKLVI